MRRSWLLRAIGTCIEMYVDTNIITLLYVYVWLDKMKLKILKQNWHSYSIFVIIPVTKLWVLPICYAVKYLVLTSDKVIWSFDSSKSINKVGSIVNPICLLNRVYAWFVAKVILITPKIYLTVIFKWHLECHGNITTTIP